MRWEQTKLGYIGNSSACSCLTSFSSPESPGEAFTFTHAYLLAGVSNKRRKNLPQIFYALSGNTRIDLWDGDACLKENITLQEGQGFFVTGEKVITVQPYEDSRLLSLSQTGQLSYTQALLHQECAHQVSISATNKTHEFSGHYHEGPTFFHQVTGTTTLNTYDPLSHATNSVTLAQGKRLTLDHRVAHRGETSGILLEFRLAPTGNTHNIQEFHYF